MATHKTQHYKVIIEKDEDGFFVAQVPALPGCVTQAKSYTQLMTRLHEAISLCLEVEETDKKYRQQKKLFSYEPTFIGIQEVTV